MTKCSILVTSTSLMLSLSESSFDEVPTESQQILCCASCPPPLMEACSRVFSFSGAISSYQGVSFTGIYMFQRQYSKMALTNHRSHHQFLWSMMESIQQSKKTMPTQYRENKVKCDNMVFDQNPFRLLVKLQNIF